MQRSSFLNYGVSDDTARLLDSKGLTLTAIKTMGMTFLQKTSGLDPQTIKFVKNLVTRQPIDDDVRDELLNRSRFTCCVCRGTKSTSYLIHHIEEYAVSQNNSYGNLAVLCPSCHDNAHRGTGTSLTLRLTENQIHRQKNKWELTVAKLDVDRACQTGQIDSLDFLHLIRITEAAFNVLGELPKTSVFDELLAAKLIHRDGSLNTEGFYKNSERRMYPFDFYEAGWILRHFQQIFNEVLQRQNFVSLDELLNAQSVKSGLEGQCCFYVGGLYTTHQKLPISEASPLSRLFFHRRSYYAEWLLDPRYFVSSSAFGRLGDKGIYLIYGMIRGVHRKIINDKSYTHFDIRPLMAGSPARIHNRIPDIYWEKQGEKEEVIDD